MRLHLFDWLVTGQIVAVNPAHAVRGPSYSMRKGKTPVLSPAEARQLLESIPTVTISGKRDRALIGLMTYSFARIGAALSMEGERDEHPTFPFAIAAARTAPSPIGVERDGRRSR